MATPDDLDEIGKSIRKKVDKNYAEKEKTEEIYRIEIEPINRKISNILFQKSTKSDPNILIYAQLLKLSIEDTENMFMKKYDSQLNELYAEKRKINEKYGK